MAGQVYIARQTFIADVDGVPQVIVAGKTRVREGHSLLGVHPDWFEASDKKVHFDMEQATAAPGEKRGDSSPQFDPTKNTVHEVLSYLKSASKDEIERVKASEARSDRNSKQVAEA
jgi:hypothetical protein